jgi:hypothetical protein
MAHRPYLAILALVSPIAVVVVLPARAAFANTITVDSAAVVAANDGDCTLPEAVTAANTNTASGAMAGECGAGAAGLDTIAFAIAGAGVHTITPTSSLTISEAVTIDGYTQPGTSMNTNAFDGGINAVLLIELNESSLITVRINASGTTVRGIVINRGTDAIKVNASNVTIAGNFIGTDPSGTVAMGGSGGGFAVRQESGDNNVYGGPTAAARNIFSGNTQGGIIVEAGSNTLVQGNYVGTDVTGTLALSGTGFRVGLNVLGGPSFNTSNTTFLGNLVSGNSAGGINTSSSGGVVIEGNLIGTQRNGTSPLGNGQSGISIIGTGTVVGGTSAGQANVIAFNVAAGITVSSLGSTSFNDRILGNSIHSNGALGISLAPTSPATPMTNDSCDADGGGNKGQNYPVITSAPVAGGNVTISGTLNSTASTTFRVEFFSNASCDASGKGEGQTFLGFTDVTTDATCNTSFGPLMFAVLPGQTLFTATATDPDGNTSEFAGCFPVGAPATATGTPVAPTATATPTPVVTATATRTTTPTISATSTPASSPMPTSTAAPGALRSFQCYAVDRQKVATIPGVAIGDAFAQNGIADLRRPTRLCAPANRDGTDPTAPAAAGHLLGYELKNRKPRFLKVKHVQVTPTGFDAIDVDVIRPVLLLAPTRKSTSADPGVADGLGLNHFQCYAVKGAKTRADDLNVVDQFGALTEDVKRPFRLCVPADKNGEGILHGDQALMCYVIRPARRPRFTGRAPLFVHDQFGARTIGIKRPTELCVPASVTLP